MIKAMGSSLDFESSDFYPVHVGTVSAVILRFKMSHFRMYVKYTLRFVYTTIWGEQNRKHVFPCVIFPARPDATDCP